MTQFGQNWFEEGAITPDLFKLLYLFIYFLFILFEQDFMVSLLGFFLDFSYIFLIYQNVQIQNNL